VKFLRAVPFFLTVPAAILLYIPVLLRYLGFYADQPILPLQILGILCWLLGGVICAWTVYAFWHYGDGTPTPSEPTTSLVERGLYRYSRNPMYLGGLVIVLGYVFWFQTWVQLIYLLLAWVFFQSLIVFWEEPNTSKRFGEAYADYRQRVPRWIGFRKSQV